MVLKLSEGAICFFALHRAAMLCSRYVFLDVVPSTSGLARGCSEELHYDHPFLFFEGLIKSQAFLYSSLNVWFLLLRSEVDVEADVAIFKYFSFKLSRKIRVQLTCVYCNGRPVMPNAFLSNVLIDLNDPMLLFFSNHKICSWKQSSISWPQDLPTSFLSRVLTG